MRRWLLPLAALWAAGARTRTLLYERGLLTRRRLGRPAVSVGALEMGGTGKSPATAAVARLLRDAGLRPAIVSRGYGRHSRGPLLVADGDRLRVGVRQAGDEPYLYAQQLAGVPVAVAARREEAAALLLEQLEVDVFVLDDAFQHQRVHRDADLLVVDSTAPFWRDAPPPAGRLREAAGAAARADGFLLVGAQQDACCAELERRFPGRPAFALATIQPGARQLADPQQATGLLPGPVLPFAGIARPQRFYRALEAAGVAALPPVAFRDHHWYTEGEIERLRADARRLGARALLTTEKDAVRLPRDDGDPPLWVWRYRLAVASADALYRFLEPRLEPRPEGR